VKAIVNVLGWPRLRLDNFVVEVLTRVVVKTATNMRGYPSPLSPSKVYALTSSGRFGIGSMNESVGLMETLRAEQRDVWILRMSMEVGLAE